MATEVATETDLQRLLRESREAREEALNFLRHNGVELQLSEWVTVKKYCEMFGIDDTQVVTNWIKRGVIPAENVRTIEELNNLRLIKAVKYR